MKALRMGRRVDSTRDSNCCTDISSSGKSVILRTF
jgi:hypothetical protein